MLDENDEGGDTFTYTILVGSSGTDKVTVTILMPGVKDPPVAEDNSDPEGNDLTMTSIGGIGVDPSGTTTIMLPSVVVMMIDGNIWRIHGGPQRGVQRSGAQRNGSTYANLLEFDLGSTTPCKKQQLNCYMQCIFMNVVK